MKKVFISGPMRGIKNWNTEEFNNAEEKLRQKGYDVFNPAWLKFGNGWEIKDILSIDIAALSRCDMIYMLKGWDNSSGARLEHEYAKKTGIPIAYQDLD